MLHPLRTYGSGWRPHGRPGLAELYHLHARTFLSEVLCGITCRGAMADSGMPVAEMCSSIWHRDTTRSASICLLRGFLTEPVAHNHNYNPPEARVLSCCTVWACVDWTVDLLPGFRAPKVMTNRASSPHVMNLPLPHVAHLWTCEICESCEML